jgi:hypothetical protein
MILFTIFAQILVEREHMSLGSNLHFPRVRVHIYTSYKAKPH